MTKNKRKFRLGLIVNPVAGVGGSVALKGSDGVVEEALARGAIPKSNARMLLALDILKPYTSQIEIYTVNGEMGERIAKESGFDTQIAFSTSSDTTTATDTENATEALLRSDIDLLLFAGGDGTARNICSRVDERVPVLGVPAGCKIHSGVYAVTPRAAGRVVEMLVKGELVTIAHNDVMDIDETLFREGVVKARRYGEMLVPSELQYVQQVKMGGKESDELVLQDIASWIISEMEEDEVYIMGSGSTVGFIMEEIGLDNTLLGVDVIQDQELVARDVTSAQLGQLIEGKRVKLVITLIGGQGHILGRGNQQLSPDIIKAVGKENIIVVATKSKLQHLDGRPLILDSGDVALDKALSGYINVVTGYNDQVMYPVSTVE